MVLPLPPVVPGLVGSSQDEHLITLRMTLSPKDRGVVPHSQLRGGSQHSACNGSSDWCRHGGSWLRGTQRDSTVVQRWVTEHLLKDKMAI